MNRSPALNATRVVALLIALLTLSQTHAATRDEQKKACRGDAIHFCSAEIPNKDKITACMKQHVSELSPGCQAMFKHGGHASGNASDANKGSAQ